MALSLDLQNRDHVKALELLPSFRFKLPCIREILPSLVDDQVKHVFEHVKLRRDPRQTSPQTTLLRRDQVHLYSVMKGPGSLRL